MALLNRFILFLIFLLSFVEWNTECALQVSTAQIQGIVEPRTSRQVIWRLQGFVKRSKNKNQEKSTPSKNKTTDIQKTSETTKSTPIGTPIYDKLARGKEPVRLTMKMPESKE